MYLRLLKDIYDLSTNNKLSKSQKISEVEAQMLCSILVDERMDEPSIKILHNLINNETNIGF